MPKDDEKHKKGRTLSGVASGIIVYILAGGTFKGTGNLMFGTVVFKNPWVLEVAVIVLFAYSMYRYYLARPEPIKNFIRNSDRNLKDDKGFRRFLNRIGKKELERRLKEGDEDFAQISDPDSLTVKWRHTGLTSPITRKGGKSFSQIQVKKDRKEIKEFPVEVPPFDRRRYIAKTCFYKEDFWVILFPWFLSLVAIALLIIRIAFM